MTLRSAESSESMFRKAQSEGRPPVHFNDPSVQVFLAKAEFPNATDPMEKWYEGEEEKDSLGRRFRAYMESPERKAEELYINVNDTASLKEIVEKIKLHPPETSLH